MLNNYFKKRYQFLHGRYIYKFNSSFILQLRAFFKALFCIKMLFLWIKCGSILKIEVIIYEKYNFCQQFTPSPSWF